MSYKNRANFKTLSEFIKRVNIKNKDGKVSELKGINIDKFFMPSVANVVGTDLTRYKVVKPQQFACNRMHVGRDYRLPIAVSKFDNNIIVSPAYDVFEIIDTNKLNPEYLMMWFSRSEFDRNCWFYTDTDVRGKLGWDSFCEIELPIPSIEKQNEIVKEYNIVVNRIKLNEQLNQKLEETAQALYKHWFVDFEFPNEEGKPYKSSGGEMFYNEELDGDIPLGWSIEFLGNIIESFSKKHDFDKDELIFFNTSDILEGELLHSNYSDVNKMPGQAKKQIKKWDILYSEIRPKNKRYALVRLDADDYVVSTKLMVLRLKTNIFSAYRLYHFLTEKNFVNDLQFSAEGRSGTFPQITFEGDLENKPFLIADENIEKIWSSFLKNYYEQHYSRIDENKILKEIKTLILSKMTKVKAEKELIN